MVGTTMTEPEVIEAETGLVVASDDALTAFGADVGLERARSIANQLATLIRERQLSVRIGQGEHLRVEAWCAAGAMVGLTPRTVWSREARSASGELEGYEARVEVVRLSTGEVVGAAEAGCYYDEQMRGAPRWTERHAVKSMSQTRATSKALGQVLRWIPVLAGYEGTPAEEMPREPREEPRSRPPRTPAPSQAVRGAPGAPEDPDAWLDQTFGTGKKVLRNGVSVKDLTYRQIVEGASLGGERHEYLRWIAEWLEQRLGDPSAARYKRANIEQLRRINACIRMIEQQGAAEPEPPAEESELVDILF